MSWWNRCHNPETGDTIIVFPRFDGAVMYTLNGGPHLLAPVEHWHVDPHRLGLSLMREYLEQRRAADPAEELTLP